jgi:ubiquinone/menaquinone biosynthesis C-methylase UbiE
VKYILDACCGGRMFWVNKQHPHAVYQDIRTDILPLKEQYGINFTVEPDIMGDFTSMKFDDKSFKMVIFDPPHLFMNKTAWMAKKYGTLKGIDWKDTISKGFKECWRVLDDYGTLIFKWNDNCVPINDIKPLFPDEPIIFNRLRSKGKKTYWYVFLKIPKNPREDSICH